MIITQKNSENDNNNNSDCNAAILI